MTLSEFHGLDAERGEASRPIPRPSPNRPSDREVGGYTLRRKLGEGGMGVVYLADTHDPVYRQVALKLIKSGWGDDSVLARFQKEREALAVMDHPHVARIYDAGSTDDGQPYFVMEYVQGESITRFADRNKLSITERLGLFCQVCEAVQHAHNKGLIHRDIKPGNVLVVDVDGQHVAKIIDFGIAKAVSRESRTGPDLTEHGQFVGTAEYMSPEQAAGAADIDTRADVYSLGILLYELISGTLPFEGYLLYGGGARGVVRVIQDSEPPRPSHKMRSKGTDSYGIAASRRLDEKHLANMLRRELEWIPLLAIQKDRADRYTSPAHLAEDVRRYLRNEALVAGPPTTVYRARKFVKRNVGALAATALVLVVALAGIVGTTIGILEAEAEAAARKLADEEVERRRVEAGVTAEVLEAILKTDGEMLGVDRDSTIDQLLGTAGAILDRRRDDMSPVVYATMRHVIAKELMAVGEVESGDRQLCEVVDFVRSKVPSEELLLAEASYELAKRRWDEGLDAEAKSLYREAIKLAERADPDGVDIAYYRVQFAGILAAEAEGLEGEERQSRIDAATDLLDRASAVNRLGTDDATRTWLLARCYRADLQVRLTGEVEQGLTALRAVATEQFAARGRVAYDAFRNTIQLLYLDLLDLERLDEAEEMARWWADEADRLLGAGNTETLNARLGSVWIEAMRGDIDSAIAMVGEARDAVEAVHGSRSRTLGRALRIQIGPCYEQLGEEELARAAFEQADEILGA